MQIKLIYDPDSWKKEFSKRSNELQNILGENLHSILHVGSTSIPNMWSKNTIDIIAVVQELNQSVVDQIQTLSYSYLGECFVPASGFFDIKDNMNESGINVHLRVVQKGHESININLCFKNTLSENPDLHSQYLELKKQLSKDPEANKKIAIPNSKVLVRKYTFSKNAFIKKALKIGSYDGIQSAHVVQAEEIEAYEKLLQEKTFSNIISVSQDINSALYNKEIIIYHGTEIIGYLVLGEQVTAHTLLDLTSDITNKIKKQIELYINFHTHISTNV